MEKPRTILSETIVRELIGGKEVVTEEQWKNFITTMMKQFEQTTGPEGAEKIKPKDE